MSKKPKRPLAILIEQVLLFCFSLLFLLDILIRVSLTLKLLSEGEESREYLWRNYDYVPLIAWPIFIAGGIWALFGIRAEKRIGQILAILVSIGFIILFIIANNLLESNQALTLGYYLPLPFSVMILMLGTVNLFTGIFRPKVGSIETPPPIEAYKDEWMD